MAKFKLPTFSWLSRREKQIDTESTGNFSVSKSKLRAFSKTAPEHQVQALLDASGVGASIPLPRDWMTFSRILYSKLSLYKDAIHKTAEFVGEVTISKDSDIGERERDAIERIWAEIGMIGEHEKTPNIRGIDALASQLVIMALKDGMAFTEDRFDIDLDLLSDEYIAQMTFDADNFEYVSLGSTSELHLRYNGEQYPQVNRETGDEIKNPFFHVLKLKHDSRDPWGLPLAAGNELITKVVVSMLISIELQSRRFGNPPTFTTVTPKDLTKIGSNQFTINDEIVSPQDALIMATENFAEAIEEALVLSSKGKAAEVVQGFPAPVDIDSRILGEGMVNMIDPDLLWKLIVVLINGFGIPPSLMNINDKSGGMNSDIFESSIKVFRTRVNACRNALAPILMQITKNRLLEEGIVLGENSSFKISFTDVDIRSEKEKQEIEKVKAETKKLQFEVYEGLSNYNPEQAEAYAKKVGLFDE